MKKEQSDLETFPIIVVFDSFQAYEYSETFQGMRKTMVNGCQLSSEVYKVSSWHYAAHGPFTHD